MKYPLLKTAIVAAILAGGCTRPNDSPKSDVASSTQSGAELATATAEAEAATAARMKAETELLRARTEADAARAALAEAEADLVKAKSNNRTNFNPNPAVSGAFSEGIDVDWEIYKGMYFYAKARLPENANVKVLVVDIEGETDIVYVSHSTRDTFPKQNRVTATQIGDRFNFKINDAGQVSIRADSPQRSDGNMLYFKGLTLKVVIED